MLFLSVNILGVGEGSLLWMVVAFIHEYTLPYGLLVVPAPINALEMFI